MKRKNNMARGCAITVYLVGPNARAGGAHWSTVPSGAAENFPNRKEGHNGMSDDIDVTYQHWNENAHSATKLKYHIQAWNGTFYYPWIMINGDKHHMSEGDERSGGGKYDGYTVKRLPDSDDFKEFEVRFTG